MSGQFGRVEFIAPHHAPDLDAATPCIPLSPGRFHDKPSGMPSLRSRHPSLYKMTETGGSHD
jgi:hypothetical protein